MRAKNGISSLVLLLTVFTLQGSANIVTESESGCIVPEIGIYTYENTVAFLQCSATFDCSSTCTRLGFTNGSCTKYTFEPKFEPESYQNLNRSAPACNCTSDKMVRLSGKETAGTYQLNNWTLYWTGCTDTESCQSTCSEGGETPVDFICLPWPTHSRICACKPQNPSVIGTRCWDIKMDIELPTEVIPKESPASEPYSIYYIDEYWTHNPAYYTRSRVSMPI